MGFLANPLFLSVSVSFTFYDSEDTDFHGLKQHVRTVEQQRRAGGKEGQGLNGKKEILSDNSKNR